MEYFFTYLLKSDDGTYYVGHTDNLENRMAQHANKTFNGFTSSRNFKLVHFIQCSTRDEAFHLEQKIKKWSRAKKEALITNNWDILRILGKKKFT